MRQWQPLPDGFHWDAARLQYVNVRGDVLRTGHDYDPGCEVQLGRDVKLCRLVEVEDIPQVEMTPERVAALQEAVHALDLELGLLPGDYGAVDILRALLAELEVNDADN